MGAVDKNPSAKRYNVLKVTDAQKDHDQPSKVELFVSLGN